MIAAYIIGVAAALGLIIWGIVVFFRYVRDRYNYNIFNWINIVLLLLILLIWIGVIFLAYFINEPMARDPMNNLICGVVTGVILIVMFFRNLKHTSLPVAVGAIILQVLSVALILLIIGYNFFLRPRRG